LQAITVPVKPYEREVVVQPNYELARRRYPKVDKAYLKMR